MAKILRFTTLASILLNAGIIIVILLIQNNLPPVVPLFYGLPVSDSQLVPKIALTIPPVVAIVFSLLDFAVVKFLKSDDFLTRILIGLTVVTSALSTITVIKIALLVGSF